ncbi:MAG: methyltransferase domain-containing protein [Fibrobacter sp.]|nr:methyltransferase domain-containing protein [Fibrobacter sp.]
MSRKLHIGGKIKTPGWEILNIIPSEIVDHVADAKDLSQFDNESFQILYASHVLEHFDYNGELQKTLKEWYRVLEPGGKLYISVPDMDTLALLFSAKNQLSLQDRFQIMRMIFGGHTNRYDYHLCGLNFEFLTLFCKEAGFDEVLRVDSFGFFNDTSELHFNGILISLNIIAEKKVPSSLS